MSIHSKAKRDARKKRETRATPQRPTGGFVAHAQLIDADGQLVAAGGRYDGHWAAIVAGKAVPGIESAALLLAMLRHIAARCEAEGRATTLTVGPVLEKAAATEAESSTEVESSPGSPPARQHCRVPADFTKNIAILAIFSWQPPVAGVHPALRAWRFE